MRLLGSRRSLRTPPVNRAGVGVGDRALHVAERRSASCDQRVVIDLAGRDQDQAAGTISLGPPGVEIVARDRRDARPRRRGSSGRAAGRRRPPPEIVEDDVVGRIARFAELLQHDVLLALEIGRVEMRRADQVGDQLDAERQMLGQQRGREAGAVAVGPGVEVAADILDRLADLARLAAAGALEHHMLEQVGEAVELRRLVARAGIGIEADRDGLDARHRPAATVRPLARVVSCIMDRGDLGAQGSGCNFGAFAAAARAQ